jgi:hypothetical protein
MRQMPRLLFIASLAIMFVGCSRSQPVPVVDSAIPFTKQLQMKKGDAYEFQLPSGRTVAVWCERPKFGAVLVSRRRRVG